MRVSLSITQFPSGPGHTLLDQIVQAADGGIDTVWVADHLIQYAPGTDPTDPQLEAYTTLGFLAGRSSRVRLGAMVSPITFRPATLLIKAVSTLDVLSGGRAWLGVGAAWNEEEHVGLGVPFPPVAERFERLEETLQIGLRMWSGDESPYEGTHYRPQRLLNSPQALQRPHPRILVGGTGEKKTLRLVAKYADACNLFELRDEAAFRHKLDVLQQHCENEGRDYAEIERTTLGTLRLSRDGAEGTQSLDQAVDRFGRLAELGVDQALVNSPQVSDPAFFEVLPDLVAALGTITPAGRG
jgi:F420-dependent oxidoreductase-like protein